MKKKPQLALLHLLLLPTLSLSQGKFPDAPPPPPIFEISTSDDPNATQIPPGYESGTPVGTQERNEHAYGKSKAEESRQRYQRTKQEYDAKLYKIRKTSEAMTEIAMVAQDKIDKLNLSDAQIIRYKRLQKYLSQIKTSTTKIKDFQAQINKDYPQEYATTLKLTSLSDDQTAEYKRLQESITKGKIAYDYIANRSQMIKDIEQKTKYRDSELKKQLKEQHRIRQDFIRQQSLIGSDLYYTMGIVALSMEGFGKTTFNLLGLIEDDPELYVKVKPSTASAVGSFSIKFMDEFVNHYFEKELPIDKDFLNKAITRSIFSAFNNSRRETFLVEKGYDLKDFLEKWQKLKDGKETNDRIKISVLQQIDENISITKRLIEENLSTPKLIIRKIDNFTESNMEFDKIELLRPIKTVPITADQYFLGSVQVGYTDWQYRIGFIKQFAPLMTDLNHIQSVAQQNLANIATQNEALIPRSKANFQAAKASFQNVGIIMDRIVNSKYVGHNGGPDKFMVSPDLVRDYNLAKQEVNTGVAYLHQITKAQQLLLDTSQSLDHAMNIVKQRDNYYKKLIERNAIIVEKRSILDETKKNRNYSIQLAEAATKKVNTTINEYICFSGADINSLYLKTQSTIPAGTFDGVVNTEYISDYFNAQLISQQNLPKMMYINLFMTLETAFLKEVNDKYKQTKPYDHLANMELFNEVFKNHDRIFDLIVEGRTKCLSAE